MSAVRQPPCAPDAEIAVLNALIVDSRIADAVAAVLQPDDFYVKRHREIYRAIQEMAAAGLPPDIVTLPEWLASRQLLEVVGGMEFIGALVRDAFTAASVEIHARIVRDRSLRRSAIDAARAIAMQAYDTENAAGQVIDDGVSSLMALHRSEASCEWTMRQASKLALQQLHEAYERGGQLVGVTTGLVDLDEVLGGYHPGDLVIVGGRPAMGKTAFMLSNAMAAAAATHPVGIISGEQPVQQLAMRLLSQRSRVEATRLRAGRVEENEWPLVTGGLTSMGELPMWVYDRSAPSLSELCRIARKWKHRHGIKALYVDYLQRLQADKDRENKSERVGDITKGLKSLARDLDIPVIALAQVKREVESRTNKRPRQSDLSDSGDIEKEADEVILLYRDEVYNAETPDKGIAEVLIDKNRHGPATFIKCAFHGPTMTFSNLASPSETWE